MERERGEREAEREGEMVIGPNYELVEKKSAKLEIW